VAGPGIESTPSKDKFVFRTGTGYDCPLGGSWTITPELFADFISTGETVYIVAVAIGYGW
jgi:hypothetical protein